VLLPLHDLAPNLYIPDPFDAQVSQLLIRCRDRGALRALPDPLPWNRRGVVNRTVGKETPRLAEHEPR
jgi:hypothetical protein